MNTQFNSFLLVVFLFIANNETSTQNFGEIDQKVTFYPSSLVISHNAKPLTFYDDTRLIHLSIDLPTISMGKPMRFANHSCSRYRTDFYDRLLDSMLQVQQTAQRLLALPFSYRMRYVFGQIFSSRNWFSI